MSELYTCFNSITTIQGVSYNQRKEYNNAWDSFRTVELYNSNVSTQRGSGNTTAIYWQFPSQESYSLYKQGANLFFYYLGYSTIVEKN